VALLLDRAEFERTAEVAHLKTVFLDDHLHDWRWYDGKFWYYGHAVAPGALLDVLVIYEFQKAALRQDPANLRARPFATASTPFVLSHDALFTPSWASIRSTCRHASFPSA